MKGPWLGLGALLVTAFATRIAGLGHDSLWLDEAYTHYRAAMDVGDLVGESIRKQHNPSYFLFMHYWIALGDDEFWLRLPSVLFGVCTVAATYAMGAAAVSPRVGLVAGLLAALSPIQLRYAQEARMYTIVTCMAAVAMAGLLFIARHPELGAEPLKASWRSDDPRARRAWLAIVLGTIGALYTHNTAVFLVASLWMAAALICWNMGSARGAFVRNWLVVNGIIGAVWALWVPFLLGQTQRVAEHFWATFPTPAELITILKQIYLFDGWGPIYMNVFIGLMFIIGLLALRGRPALGPLLLLSFAPVLLLIGVSLHTPMLMPRIMLWAALPFFVIVACGVFGGARKSTAIGLLIVLTALGARSVDRYHRHSHRWPWREIATLVGAASPTPTIIVSMSSQEATILGYYFGRRSDPLPAATIVHPRPARVLPTVRGAGVVWVVDRKNGEQAAPYLERLRKHGTLRSAKRYGRHGRKIMVYRIEMHPPGA